MYDASLIARLIINHCIKKNKPISNLQLVKFIFFIQYDFWKIYNRLFFTNTFIKTTHGAFVEDVYREFRTFICYPIDKTQETYGHIFYDENNNIIRFVQENVSDICIREEDWNFIIQEIEIYEDKDIWDLVEMTLENPLLINLEEKEQIIFEIR